jgi:hypothetical protein
MLRAFIESNLAFMAESRNHVAATVEIALNARAADGSPVFGQRFNEAAVGAVREMLIHFQGTGEFRADFDPQVMAMAVRAATDTAGPRLVLYLASHIVLAARDGTGGPSICATPSPSPPW